MTDENTYNEIQFLDQKKYTFKNIAIVELTTVFDAKFTKILLCSNYNGLLDKLKSTV